MGVTCDKNVWKAIPFANFIGFVFLASHPHGYDEISSILTNVGLVSALLFTVVGAIPLSFSMEELYANDNYHGPVIPGITQPEVDAIVQQAIDSPGSIEVGRAGCICFGRFLMSPYSSGLYNFYTHSVHLLGMALLLSVFVNISLMAVTDKEGADKANTPKLQAWWKWAKFCIAFIMIAMILGIVTTFQALQDVMHTKVPIYLQNKICIDAGWVYARTDEETGARLYVNGTFVDCPTDKERFANQHLDPTAFNKIYQLFVLIPIVVIGVFVLGYINRIADAADRMSC